MPAHHRRTPYSFDTIVDESYWNGMETESFATELYRQRDPGDFNPLLLLREEENVERVLNGRSSSVDAVSWIQNNNNNNNNNTV